MEKFCPEIGPECLTSTPTTQGETSSVGMIPHTSHWMLCIQSFENWESKILQIKSMQDKMETVAEGFVCITIPIESESRFY